MKKNIRILFCLVMVLVLALCVLTACNIDTQLDSGGDRTDTSTPSVNKITVTFDVDGEDYFVINAEGNETIQMPKVPRKGNYIFVGWYYDKDAWQVPFTEASILTQKPTKNFRVYARWQTPTEGLEFEFAASGNTYIVSGFTGSATEVFIPSIYNRTPVSGIGTYAFSRCSGLTSITIPNSVTRIGSDAFSGCIGLTSITIPNSVTRIGSSVFSGCIGLTSITIPNSVTNIGSSVFSGCSGLISVTIPGSVTNIGYDAFSGCSGLTSITIPDSVTKIADRAFEGCSGLTSITIGSKVTSIGSQAFDGCFRLIEVFNKSDLNITAGSTDNGNVGYYAKNVYTPTSGQSKLSTDENGYIIYTDGSDKILFGYTGTENSLNLPEEIMEIYQYAFYKCTGLTSVTIPNSVTSIGDRAFEGCSSLMAVRITDLAAWCGINFASSSANPLYSAKNLYLNGNLVAELVIPEGVADINSYAFYNCSGLTSVTISDSVTSIGSEAFGRCYRLIEVFNKSDLNITAGSTDNGYVGYYAKNVYTPSSGSASTYSTDKDGYIIYTNGANKILIGYTGTETSLTLPEGITEINKYAFADCSKLTSITIPDSVTSIGKGAFYCCTGLIKITLPFIGNRLNGATDAHFGYIFGASSDYEHSRYIPTSLESVIITGGTTISESAFHSCKSLTSVTIPDSVTSIGDSAFGGCTGLTSITIGSKVSSIGDSAFGACRGLMAVHITDLAAWCGIKFANFDATPLYYAKNLYLNDNLLTEFVIPEGVTDINSYAFSGCSGLTNITIPNSVISIGEYAFYFCTGLTSVTIPNSVISIGDRAFKGCTGLTSVTIGNKVKSIGWYAFQDCSGLTSIIIPNSVTSIAVGAFNNCISLTDAHITDLAAWCDIYFESYDANPLYYAGNLYFNRDLVTKLEIPEGVADINSYAFSGYSGLTNITIPDSVTSIGVDAFYKCYKLIEVFNKSDLNIIAGSTGNGYVGYYAKNVYTPTSGGAGTFTTDDDGYIIYEYDTNKILFGYTGTDISLTLPEGITEINQYAFTDRSKLTSVIIPNSVTSIGSNAFDGCTGLTSITIPDSVTSIGNYAFCNCSKLTSIIFSDTTTWYKTGNNFSWPDKTGGTLVDVTNSSTNATNFKDTYLSYYWYKL